MMVAAAAATVHLGAGGGSAVASTNALQACGNTWWRSQQACCADLVHALESSLRLAACLPTPPSACVCYAAGNMHDRVALCRLGGVYRPSVVRVGLQAHHSVEHVALDTLIDRRMSANKDAPVRSLKCK